MQHATRTAFAAAILAGSLALAPGASAQGQGQGQGQVSPIPHGNDWATRFLDRYGLGEDQRQDRVNAVDYADAYDRYLRDMRNGENDWHVLQRDRYLRRQFDRGYRQGREDARRQAGAAGRHASQRWDAASQSLPLNRLESAAARLREALVAMQREPASEARDRAIDQARQALIRTQNAYTWLPRQGGGEGEAGGATGS